MPDRINNHITVAAGEHDGKPVRELVPVKELAPNRYEVLASPGFANGFAAGDLLELVDSEGHFRVLRRGGNICVQIFFLGDKQKTIRQFNDRFKPLAGWLDGGTDSGSSHCIIYTIPKAAGFSAIKKVFVDLAPWVELDIWMYGNVYTDDGSPLNWWS